MNLLRCILCLALLMGAVSCPAVSAEPLKVFVSIQPQKYFVTQIAKELADVQVMVKPGASPATYEPKPQQMAGLSAAQLYFSIGVPFENAWLKKIAAANPKMKIIPTDQGITKIPMVEHDIHDDHDSGHHHESDHHRGHDGLDPHIWLSPRLVEIQAGIMLEALSAQDPENQERYLTNYQKFIQRIQDLDRELTRLFKPHQQMRFMVFHPSWGYFAQTYGLEQMAIEIEGKDPKPSQLKELIQQAREHRIRVIFVQPQFSTRNAQIVAKEINGQLVYADPLALDWFENMQRVAGHFKEALR